MKLTGELKEQVEKAENKEEAKEMIRDTIEEAGMPLDDEELDKASGGAGFSSYTPDNLPR